MSKKFNPVTVERLFHATCEPLVGALRPGGYDHVFWTAESSAIAQTYIPEAGGTVFMGIRSFELDERVRPGKHSAVFDLARTVGPVPYDIEYDEHGQAKSWRIPEGCVTYRDVVNYVQEQLGYRNRSASPSDYMFEILSSGWSTEAGTRFEAANYRIAGSLVIVDGFQEMRFADLSAGESDLTDLQYHKLAAFRRAEAEGYDGIIIDDFAQSKTWGNVGHRSIGFFAGALDRLRTEAIPCVRFDWSERDIRLTDSPEFLLWSRARTARAQTRPRASCDPT